MSTSAAPTTIRTGGDTMTLVNVFTVDPEHQQELVDILVEATDVMLQLPGFISANLHRSPNGERVVNYVQWRSRADFDAMLLDPRAIPHMQRAAELAQYDPIITEVVHTRHI